MRRCRPKPGTTLPPLCSHTPSEAPAPAHCEPARRAQMCLRHGQAGSRGSADPLEACGAEYHIGIVDEQVCAALPLHTHSTLARLLDADLLAALSQIIARTHLRVQEHLAYRRGQRETRVSSAPGSGARARSGRARSRPLCALPCALLSSSGAQAACAWNLLSHICELSRALQWNLYLYCIQMRVPMVIG